MVLSRRAADGGDFCMGQFNHRRAGSNEECPAAYRLVQHSYGPTRCVAGEECNHVSGGLLESEYFVIYGRARFNR